jgi:phosphoenolpyruvate carboxykinase (GTP)
MAMLPFMGYNASDYFNHWLETGKQADAAKLPKIFLVNWFRRDEDGGFLWPGFGENARVLKWMVDRIAGRVDAQESPIGYLPLPEDIDTDGLDLSAEDLSAALAFDRDEWEAEIPLIKEWFDKFGEELPAALRDELATLEQRLAGQEV